MLVVSETALALMLLVAAGLLIKSYSRLQAVDPGFSAENVLTTMIALPQARYPDPAARRAFWDRLIDRAHALPGVTSAALTSNVPFSGSVSSGSYSIVGYTPGPTDARAGTISHLFGRPAAHPELSPLPRGVPSGRGRRGQVKRP